METFRETKGMVIEYVRGGGVFREEATKFFGAEKGGHEKFAPKTLKIKGGYQNFPQKYECH